MDPDEKATLLGDDLPPYATTRATWVRFCVCFGMLHGCAVTSMAYASSFQGRSVSSITLSVFFGAYTLSALLVATNVVRSAGVLHSLLLGFAGYVALSLSYVSYELLGGGLFADCLVVAASLVAGVGGGLLWVAQTAQYAVASQAYAEVQDIEPAEASSEFAAIFAAIYVSAEALVKLATSLTLVAGASLTGAIASLVALGALATLAFLWNPLDIGLGYRARRPGDERLPIFDSSGLRAVLSAHASDARLWYLAPLTLGFGYSSALFTDWVDSVVDEERGDSTVALVSAITTITAGVAVFPVNAIFAYGGSRAPVALAVLAYGTLGALILGLGSLDRISEWSNLVAIFALQGVNRAIFENSTKFIFLDTFRGSGHVDAALASIYAHSGFASTVTFASLFSENIGLAGAALLLFALGIGLGFYLVDRGPRGKDRHVRPIPERRHAAFPDRFQIPSPGPPIMG